jgi:hypothetical protein
MMDPWQADYYANFARMPVFLHNMVQMHCFGPLWENGGFSTAYSPGKGDDMKKLEIFS